MQFWALFLDSSVEKDRVPGVDDWWNKASREEREQAERYAIACVAKIERDKRDSDECIAAAVEALRQKIAFLPKDEYQRPEYMRFRLGLLDRIRGENLRPFEVAAVLEQARNDFPEIDQRETDAFQAMGTVWQPWRGFDFDYAANGPAWEARGIAWEIIQARNAKERARSLKEAEANA